jgi:monoamine oxidase
VPLSAIRSVHVTTWNLDPWTGGPYSTLAVGGTPQDRRTLARPVAAHLVLAGEHTSAEHPATMHGALSSGRRAARQLLEANPGARSTIVVGAGLAGLGAARMLHDHGRSVTVLEATAGPGGRARTERTADGLTVHPGAAWIHGVVGNPVAELADALGIAHHPWPRTDRPPHVRHAVVGLGSVDADHDAIAAARSAAERRLADARTAHTGPDTTMRGPLRSATDAIADALLRTAAHTQLRLHHESLLAGHLDDLSFLHGDEPFACPGPDEYLTTPLAPLVGHLADGLDIRPATPVTALRWADGRVQVRTGPDPRPGPDPRDAGPALAADEAVIAVPVTPLQSGALTLDPPLPEAHAAALGRLRMGEKAKVLVRFDERWWGDTERLWLYPAPGTPPDAPLAWALWVDASALCGAPVLCGFLGGSEAVRVQHRSLTEAGRAALAGEIADVLRWAAP